jgi:radical SAM protein with 4Fe4S-binding SPASM domain
LKRGKVYIIDERDGRTLAYSPDASELFYVSSSERSSIPNEIDLEDDRSCDLPCDNWPPRFTNLQLHLTSRCNSKCIYCYSDSNVVKEDLAEKQISSSIDYYCKHMSSEDVNIGFFGGGEPLVAWDRLQYAIEHSRDVSASLGVTLNLSLVSNGIWSDRQCDFVVEHFNNVTLSFDGPAEIQNRYRPILSGEDSFQKISHIAKRINSNEGVALTLSPIITSETVGRLKEIVSFFCEEYPGATIYPSCLREYGDRIKSSGLKPPSIEVFCSSILESQMMIDTIGSNNKLINPFFSTAPDTVKSFCGACGDNCIVSSGGFITSCGSVTRPEDQGGDFFICGEVGDAGVYIDKDKYLFLRSELSGNNLKECDVCFAKNICRGGCPSVKVRMGDFWRNRCANCESIKNAFKEYLWKLAEE